MGKFFAFIFGLGKEEEEHNDMVYYYDDIESYSSDTMCYREHDIVYSNDAFDGGHSVKEEDSKLNKSSDIF